MFDLFEKRLYDLLLARDTHSSIFPVGYHYSIAESHLSWFGDDEAARREETRRKLNETSARFDQLRKRVLADYEFDATTLVKLPKLQAATKLLLDDGMHQYRLSFSHAITRECSNTVRAMLTDDSPPSFPLHPEHIPAGERARRIRQRNRRRYQPQPEEAKQQPQAPQRRTLTPPQPPKRTPQPATPPITSPSLPVMAEVDIDE